MDRTNVGFDVRGAHYSLHGTEPPFAGLTGSVTIGDGRFDARPFNLVSGNVRLRSPGAVSLVVSGGVTWLPVVTITGSAPLTVQTGVPLLPPLERRLRLEVAPDQAEHRVGVNVGAGLRLGGDRVGLMAEVRGFFFREYELHFHVEDAADAVSGLVERFEGVRFRPVVVNVVAGLVFRF